MMKREDRYIFKPVFNGDNLVGFDVFDREGNLLLCHDEEYFIYMKSVNFRRNGSINGRYLGEASDILIDGYSRKLNYNDGQYFTENGEQIRTARMVVLDNNKNDSKVIMIIK